jgi:enolase-phosphatase E1
MPPRALLLDIEGTTTPIAFVYRVLFPYARNRVDTFLRRHADRSEVRFLLDQLRADFQTFPSPGPLVSGDSRDIESLVTSTVAAMDADRKMTSLKALQGLIWEEGYRSGELHGEVFDDVPGALERWHRAGLDVRIYSSGSVLAQQLLFRTVQAGDLTTYLSGYFDTETGAKTDVASYQKIAAAFERTPGDVLFISDVVAELAAARAAGLMTCLAVRPGNPPQPNTADFRVVHDFDGL